MPLDFKASITPENPGFGKAFSVAGSVICAAAFSKTGRWHAKHIIHENNSLLSGLVNFCITVLEAIPVLGFIAVSIENRILKEPKNKNVSNRVSDQSDRILNPSKETKKTIEEKKETTPDGITVLRKGVFSKENPNVLIQGRLERIDKDGHRINIQEGIFDESTTFLTQGTWSRRTEEGGTFTTDGERFTNGNLKEGTKTTTNKDDKVINIQTGTFNESTGRLTKGKLFFGIKEDGTFTIDGEHFTNGTLKEGVFSKENPNVLIQGTIKTTDKDGKVIDIQEGSFDESTTFLTQGTWSCRTEEGGTFTTDGEYFTNGTLKEGKKTTTNKDGKVIDIQTGTFNESTGRLTEGKLFFGTKEDGTFTIDGEHFTNGTLKEGVFSKEKPNVLIQGTIKTTDKDGKVIDIQEGSFDESTTCLTQGTRSRRTEEGGTFTTDGERFTNGNLKEGTKKTTNKDDKVIDIQTGTFDQSTNELVKGIKKTLNTTTNEMNEEKVGS